VVWCALVVKLRSMRWRIHLLYREEDCVTINELRKATYFSHMRTEETVMLEAPALGAVEHVGACRLEFLRICCLCYVMCWAAG